MPEQQDGAIITPADGFGGWKAYRIVDWERLYENNRTRDMKAMQWVPVPVKHDGFGYCSLVEKNGAARLGAWLAILQTAAKSHPRGTLLRDGRHPHTAESIAVKTRLDAGIIAETIQVCLSESVQWLEVVDSQGNAICRAVLGAEIPQAGAEIPQAGARKGRKGIEEKGTLAPPARVRNPVIDALGSIEGNIAELDKAAWARIGKALSQIREVTPDVTPEEIARRGVNYRSHFDKAALTASALAKHWARCGAAAVGGANSGSKLVNTWHDPNPDMKMRNAW